MPIPERFSLWTGDTPLNARDEVADEIVKLIDTAISECDVTDTCWLNYVITYMCCLSAVANSYGGLTCCYDQVRKWRKEVLRIFDSVWEERNETYYKDLAYINSVIDSLFEAVDHSTIESAQEEWP